MSISSIFFLFRPFVFQTSLNSKINLKTNNKTTWSRKWILEEEIIEFIKSSPTPSILAQIFQKTNIFLLCTIHNHSVQLHISNLVGISNDYRRLLPHISLTVSAIILLKETNNCINEKDKSSTCSQLTLCQLSQLAN